MKDREQQLAELNIGLGQLEEQKRENARYYKTLIEAKRAEMDRLATEILQGKESLFGSDTFVAEMGERLKEVYPDATIGRDETGGIVINMTSEEDRD